MIIRELFEQGNALLKGRVDTPFLDTRLLLEHVLRISHTQLLLRMDALVDEESVKDFWQALNRRFAGECVAYIIGYKEFWELPFAVSPSVLVPRPDTETLMEASLSFVRQGRIETVLELCTGSGAVAVSLKHECPFLTVTASDISQEALAIARKNAQRLQTDISFIHSDLFEHIGGRFDMIVANPPYVPTGVIETLSREAQNEPRLALDGGRDGLDLIRKIVVSASSYLQMRGVLLLEAGSNQMPAIQEMMNGYRERRIFRDLAGRERVIAGIKG